MVVGSGSYSYKAVSDLDVTLAVKDAEIAAQKEAERIESERKAAEAKAAKAPLKTKMTVWVDSFEIADFESNPTSDEIKVKFEAFKKWSKEQIAKL